jgi:hypothetical protein
VVNGRVDSLLGKEERYFKCSAEFFDRETEKKAEGKELFDSYRQFGEWLGRRG